MKNNQLRGDELLIVLKLFFTKHYIQGKIGKTIKGETNSATITGFIREMNLGREHPGFRKVFFYLIEKGVLINTNEIGNIKGYKLNRVKLQSLIDEQEVLNLHKEYLKQVAILYD